MRDQVSLAAAMPLAWITRREESHAGLHSAFGRERNFIVVILISRNANVGISLSSSGSFDFTLIDKKQ